MGDAVADCLELIVGNLLLGERGEPSTLVIGANAHRNVGEFV